MIYDLLANIGNYRGMNRNLDKAIDYLMTVDINTLPLGKTEIDGDRVFLQVMEARTHELTDEDYEVQQRLYGYPDRYRRMRGHRDGP